MVATEGGSRLDERWGKRIASWGYVTLTVDRFGPRGLNSTCTGGTPPDDLPSTPIGAELSWRNGPFVDPDRVAVLGFSQGGWLALTSVERGYDRADVDEKFRAADRVLSALPGLSRAA